MTSQDDTEGEIALMTKAEFRARLKAIGMRPANFTRATMLTRQAVLEWGKSRDYPTWVHSWLILAEHSPAVARLLGRLHLPGQEPVRTPRPPPPIRRKKGAVDVRPEIKTDRGW